MSPTAGLPGYDPQTGVFSAPPYLGKESKALIDRINDKVSAAGGLNKIIAFGTALSMAESPHVGAAHVVEAVEAMGAIPVIVRGTIQKEIGLELIKRDTKMNKEERAFWEQLYNGITKPGAWLKEHDPQDREPCGWKEGDPTHPCPYCGAVHAGTGR